MVDSRCTLKKNSDFRRLYSKGQSAVNPYVVVYCRRNREKVNRLGYTVSTKLGHAVVRNRVRRRLREICRLNSPAMKKGFDVNEAYARYELPDDFFDRMDDFIKTAVA